MNSTIKKIITAIIPHPILTMVLLLMWLSFNNSIALGHILFGLILSLLLAKLTANFWSKKLVSVHKIPQVLAFMVLMIHDVIIANIKVAIQILGKNENLKPLFLEIPLSAKNPYAIALFANCITLTPGTVSTKISLDGKTLFVHALNVQGTPEEEINNMKQRYEARIIKIFSEEVKTL